jgi:predicted amidohydrolase YtcJ
MGDGARLIETFWTPPVFPTRWDLDKISPNNPVFLRGRTAWRCRQQRGAKHSATSPKTRRIPSADKYFHDKQTGEPVGMLPTRRRDW